MATSKHLQGRQQRQRPFLSVLAYTPKVKFCACLSCKHTMQLARLLQHCMIATGHEVNPGLAAVAAQTSARSPGRPAGLTLKKKWGDWHRSRPETGNFTGGVSARSARSPTTMVAGSAQRPRARYGKATSGQGRRPYGAGSAWHLQQRDQPARHSAAAA